MEWIKEFDDEFPELHIAHGAFSAEGEPLYIDERDRLKTFITTQITKARESALDEAIALSDKIEAQNETVFDEWRGFKQFRNTLRALKTTI